MPPQPPSDNSTAGKIFAILIILLYLYSAPDPYAGSPTSGFHSPRDQYNAYLARQWHSYSVLNSSRYGDFRPALMGGTWLNMTGFKESDGFAWEKTLGVVKEKVEGMR